ncbi:MAG TPA: hypothetical protein VEZ91_11950 [Kurthia gibsonii]|nr:hypothetical protein [Kurthia gibsonii]
MQKLGLITFIYDAEDIYRVVSQNEVIKEILVERVQLDKNQKNTFDNSNSKFPMNTVTGFGYTIDFINN